MIKLIVAVDRGNAIGWQDGRLPWRLPLDMARFKELTTSHTVVMGMNTWKSLKRPTGLPNRKNVVLTRKPYMEARQYFSASADYEIISSLDYIKQQAERWKHLTYWIIGGASVYAEALAKDLVDEAYVTLVDDNSGADVTLGADLAHWKHWVLTEQNAGRNWLPTLGTSQRDGDFHTTYLHLERIRSC